MRQSNCNCCVKKTTTCCRTRECRPVEKIVCRRECRRVCRRVKEMRCEPVTRCVTEIRHGRGLGEENKGECRCGEHNNHEPMVGEWQECNEGEDCDCDSENQCDCEDSD